MERAEAEKTYNFDIVRWFSVVSVIYLVVGTAIGVYIAAELAGAKRGSSHMLTAGQLDALQRQVHEEAYQVTK